MIENKNETKAQAAQPRSPLRGLRLAKKAYQFAFLCFCLGAILACWAAFGDLFLGYITGVVTLFVLFFWVRFAIAVSTLRKMLNEIERRALEAMQAEQQKINKKAFWFQNQSREAERDAASQGWF